MMMMAAGYCIRLPPIFFHKTSHLDHTFYRIFLLQHNTDIVFYDYLFHPPKNTHRDTLS